MQPTEDPAPEITATPEEFARNVAEANEAVALMLQTPLSAEHVAMMRDASKALKTAADLGANALRRKQKIRVSRLLAHCFGGNVRKGYNLAEWMAVMLTTCLVDIRLDREKAEAEKTR